MKGVAEALGVRVFGDRATTIVPLWSRRVTEDYEARRCGAGRRGGELEGGEGGGREGDGDGRQADGWRRMDVVDRRAGQGSTGQGGERGRSEAAVGCLAHAEELFTLSGRGHPSPTHTRTSLHLCTKRPLHKTPFNVMRCCPAREGCSACCTGGDRLVERATWSVKRGEVSLEPGAWSGACTVAQCVQHVAGCTA